jgi:hypothetical protein
LNNIFRTEMITIIKKILEATKKIPRVECYLKNGEELFIWGLDEHDPTYIDCEKKIKKIIEDNYIEI